MPESTHFDAIIIGSGQGGNPLAAALSDKGKRTAVIERADVGGTCVNSGCTPTKTMVASAEVAYLARRGKDYGVHTGDISVDMTVVRERKRNIVKRWREGSENGLKRAALVELIRGQASFVGPKQINVRLNEGGERTLTAEWIFLNTGLSTTKPPLAGLDTVPWLDNASIMELDTVPEHLIVLGGGYVGLEFAQMFQRFGSHVTVIQRGNQLLPAEDTDVADEITKFLREDGMDVLLNATAETVSSSGKTITLTVQQDGATKAIEGTHLLIATGRHPNTADLNLPAAGITTDKHGFVPVNDKLETTVPGIYAIGDVKGGPAFTHISYDDFRIHRDNLLEGRSASIANRVIPYCVFLDPQLGRVGLNEKEAAQQGKKVRIARIPMTSVARAVETDRSRGFMKALVDPETEQILGAAILAEEGGEIMAMIQIAMMGKLRYTALREGDFAHPTLAESLNTLFSNFEPD
jgi:pyruvate/2-oxoglutarate dehydrogenase complex dihydrolipoamide dehydrogenase (E3) component